MSKVLVERPRLSGRGSGYPRAALERPFGREIDDAPTKSGIAWLHRKKWLNENLAPLRHFLLSRVGSPWANVYSEISANVSRDSAVQAHIFQHIDAYVARNIELRDGRPFLTDGYWTGWLFEHRGRLQLYVCPKTGILRRAKRARKATSRFGRSIRLDRHAELREIDGRWMHVTLAPIPPAGLSARPLRDVLLSASIGPSWFDNERRYAKLFGRTDAYAVSIREPGKRELERTRR